MRTLSFVTLASVVTLSSNCLAQEAVGTHEMWRTDLPAALKAAQTTNKPLLLLFRCEP